MIYLVTDLAGEQDIQNTFRGISSSDDYDEEDCLATYECGNV